MADPSTFAPSAISVSIGTLVGLVAAPLGAFLVMWGMMRARLADLERRLALAEDRDDLHGSAVVEHGQRLKTVEAEVERLRDRQDPLQGARGG